jgi:uncharacterized coiled-coil protein SlyX
MVAPRILAARSQEAEAQTVEILESLGTLDQEDLKHRQANALKEPIAFAARQSELLLSLARTVAEQRIHIDRLERQVAEGTREAKPEKTSEAAKEKAKK